MAGGPAPRRLAPRLRLGPRGAAVGRSRRASVVVVGGDTGGAGVRGEVVRVRVQARVGHGRAVGELGEAGRRGGALLHRELARGEAGVTPA